MFYATLLIFLYQTTVAVSDPQCTNNTFNEIRCPYFSVEPEVSIKFYKSFKNPEHIEIQCYTENFYGSLPKLKLGILQSLRIQDCLVKDGIFANFLKDLEIKATRSLKFEYTNIFENYALNATHFDGFREGFFRLDIVGNAIFGIDEGTFAQMKDLKVLVISRNDFKAKLGNIFEGLENLEHLFLERNYIRSLNIDVFEKLKKLQTLDLNGNNLENLEEGIFRNLSSLSLLDLMENNIREIPSNLLSNLKNLKVVNLSYNKIQNLPGGLLRNNRELVNVSLSGNYNLQLKDGFFSDFVYLYRISLSECNMNSIEENIFTNSTGISIIDLSYNNLTTLPRNLFKGLKNLQILNLKENHLRDLHDDIFKDLESLRFVILSNNHLKKIGSNLFRNSLLLEELKMNHNTLESVEIRNLERLRILDLRNNKIKILEENWVLLPKLTHLDLSENLVSNLEFYFFSKVKMLNLEINLGYNRIENVDFKVLKEIIKDRFDLDARSSKEGNLKIHLDGNFINCDCRAIDLIRYFRLELDTRIPTLVDISEKNLYCSKKNSYPISTVIKSPSLLICYVEECPDYCLCKIRPFDSNLIIDCSYKSLECIPKFNLNEINHEYAKIEMHLQGNLIKKIEENKNLYNVTHLNLSHNLIEELHWLPPKLQLLDLSSNFLSYIPETILSSLNNLNLSLNLNPWECSCENLYFSQFLRDSSDKNILLSNNITCQDGRFLIHLKQDELCKRIFLLYIGIIASIFLLCFTVMFALYYKYQLELKLWLFSHHLFLWWITEEELDKNKNFDVFISYSHLDEAFVVENILPELENGPIHYDVCLHFRNWPAGKMISQQIAYSVEESRRTLIVLSPNFLKSVWGKMEFKTAHKTALEEGRVRVIIILLGDVKEEELDDDFKAYFKTNTYIKWGDPKFWTRLKYALPHKNVWKKEENSLNNKTICETSIDMEVKDKFTIKKDSFKL